MSLLLSTFKKETAKNFIKSVRQGLDQFYVFIGRTQEWEDEEIIPGLIDSFEEQISLWNSMNGLKRITEFDVEFGFRRIDWNSNRIYDEYDNTIDLSNKDFYVITDENKVYKCISNNNRSESFVKPVHTSTETSFEVDGYKWKYMFTVSDASLDKYIIPEFLPIDENETVKNNATAGTIDNVKVVSGGSGYRANASVDEQSELPVFIQGNGTQNASAIVEIEASEGRIINVELRESGADYPFAPEQNFPVAFRQTNPNGTIQTAYGIASSNQFGEIDNVNLVIAGENYVSGTAQVVQSSCRAFAETDGNGVINNAEVFAGRTGENFTVASAIVVDPDGEGADLIPLVSPLRGHGAAPEDELFANFVLINLRLAGDESFLDLDEFRQIGIVKNPKVFGLLESDGSGIELQDTIADAKWKLTVDQDTSLFTQNETVVGENSQSSGLYLNVLDSETIRVSIDQSVSGDLIFEEGETIQGLESGTFAAITNVEPPDVEPYSGEIFYINNREIITRDTDLQIETLTLVIQY